MICERVKPSAFASEYIKEYLIVHLEFNKQEAAPIKVYPINPKEGITFQFIGSLIAETPSLAIIEQRPRVNIFAIPSAPQIFRLSHKFMFVNVEFQPGALSRFLNIPITELINGSLDASLILGKEIEAINDQMANTGNYCELPIILDNFFIKKIKKLKGIPLPIDKIGFLISENPSNFNLDQIARLACMSHRTFENRFFQKVGVNPKYFARICRFYKAYEMKELSPKLDWLSIAVQNGYTDYQHLVKDFKEFSGVTPNVLLNRYIKTLKRDCWSIRNL